MEGGNQRVGIGDLEKEILEIEILEVELLITSRSATLITSRSTHPGMGS